MSEFDRSSGDGDSVETVDRDHGEAAGEPRIIGRRSARVAGAKMFDLRPIRERADAMLAEARQAVEEAEAEAQRIREVARREGLETGRIGGLEQGRHEGIEQGLAEAAEIRQTLVALIDDLQGHRSALKADAERHLTDLAVAIAERVIKTRIDVDQDVVKGNLAAALELVISADHLRILVASEDVEAVRAYLPELAAKFRPAEANEPSEAFELVADPTITRGGCIVRTAGGEIDAQIETQLDEIRRQLEE